MDHVVAVAEIGDLAPGEPAERLLHGQQVAQRLHRVAPVGEAVEDRHRRGRGDLLDIAVRGDAGDDAVDIAAQHLRGVGQTLAPLDLQVVHAEEDGLAAELRHTRFERDAGAGAGVLEDHAERLASQVAVRLARLAQLLQPDGGFEHLDDLVAGQIRVGEDAAPLQARADGEGREIARAGAAERDRARGDRLGERVGLRLNPGQARRRMRYRPRIRRGGRFEHDEPPSVPDVDGTPGAGRRIVRRIRTEGARGVCSRGTTLLARDREPPVARISRLFVPWEPPT